jgi:hypothetical protein
MSEVDGTTFIERILDKGARKLSGGLHPMELLARIDDAAVAAVRDRVMPNQIVITFHPTDYAQFEPSINAFKQEVNRMLDRTEAREGFTRLGIRLVHTEISGSSIPGSPGVVARFADVHHRPSKPLPGQTQQLEILRDATLVTSDGTRIAITHVPFTIGRASWNDLPLANMAVSRAHARIISTPDGLAIEDLGSRNGVIVDGTKQERIALAPGAMVRIGDVYFWLEYRG